MKSSTKLFIISLLTIIFSLITKYDLLIIMSTIIICTAFIVESIEENGKE